MPLEWLERLEAHAPLRPRRSAHDGLLRPAAPRPEFIAAASDGSVYRLDDLLADARVLLAFYPGNDTPG